MKRPLTIALALAASLTLSACSDEDMDYFLNSGTSNYTPGWSSSPDPIGQRAGVARCYQTSRDRQTCFY